MRFETTRLGSMLAAAAIVAMLAPAGVRAQSFVETAVEVYSQPGEFTLFDQQDNEIISYESPRDVRICVRNNRHAVPLEVRYDDKTALVRPSNCFEFEAKRVVISPARPLEETWTLNGTVETRGRG